MTTASIDASIVLISETEETDPLNLSRVEDGLAFQFLLDGMTRMLSSGDFSDEESTKGFIYVPSLDPDDQCVNSTSPLIPQNVTRRQDFPRSDYDLVALAPWVSPDCTLSYLAAASSDDARGFIFYKPESPEHLPPPVTNSMWDLKDAGEWKESISFPVYAVPDWVGVKLMNASAHYSEKLADAEHGSELVQNFNANDLPRLAIYMASDEHSGTLPNLWIFLIGVLAALLFIVFSSSLAMRWVQRRRRRSLARRLAAGEVDLEAIGIKKLKVPQSVLNKMPLYIYTESSTTPVGEKPSDTATRTNGNESRPGTHRAQYGTVGSSAKEPETQHSPASSPERKPGVSHKQRPSLPENNLMFSQSTCAICLSDYVPLSTNVRELPCGHIFHPECIDTFLLQTSSRCPLCKESSLPPGFCPPEVTNAMVYRERLARTRERELRTRSLPTPIPTRGEVHRTRRGYVRPARSPASRTTAERSTGDNQSGFGRLRFWGRSIETDTPQADDNIPPSGNPPPSGRVDDHEDDATHEERMRQRALAMLGPDHAEEFHDRDEESIPRWRRVWNKYFPGFR